MSKKGGTPVRLRRALLVLALTCTGCGMIGRDPPAIDRSQDERIQREVEARLAAEPLLATYEIRVTVEGAIVVLYGSVAGIGAWQCAIRNAELVSGVVTVTDYLVIERSTAPAPCRAPRRTDLSMARILPPPVGWSPIISESRTPSFHSSSLEDELP